MRRVKVTVDSNLHVSNIFEPPVELHFESEIATVEEVLERLENMCGSIQFLGKDGELGHEVDELLINGENYLKIAGGLKAPLKEGDRVKVEIHMELLGGG